MWSATVNRVFCHFFGEVGLFYDESDFNTWKKGCENSRKILEVIILTNVIFGSKSDLRLYALNALRNSPNRHYKEIKKSVLWLFLLIRKSGMQRFLWGILLNGGP